MPRTDPHRFGQIRGEVPQVSPKRASPTPRAPKRAKERDYWGNDRAVEGGPAGLRQRGHPPRYYFEKQFRGETIKRTLGTNLNQARRQAQDWLNAMERGDFSRADVGIDQTRVGPFLVEAVRAREARANLGRKSIASYRGRIDNFLKYLDAEHPRLSRLSDVTPGVCQGFVEWRRRQKVSRSGKAVNPETPRNHPAGQTVHDDVRRLRHLFAVGLDRGLLKANPWASIKIAVKTQDRPSPPRPMSESEVRRMLKAAREYDRAPHGSGSQSTFRGMFHDMLQFYVLSGLRREELIYLPWCQVNFDAGRYGSIAIDKINVPVDLIVYPSAAQAERLDALAESRGDDERLFANVQQMQSMVPSGYVKQDAEAFLRLKTRSWDAARRALLVPTRVVWKPKATCGTVPLVPETREILERRKRRNPLGSPFVFPHPKDGGQLRSDPLPIFTEVLETAGLPKHFRLHDLRHTFAVTLRRKGMRLETLQGLMRHKNIEDTTIYAPYGDEEGAEGIQMLHGFAR